MTDSRMTPTNDAPVTVEQGQTWQHIKRGTAYEVLGVAELQAGQPQHEKAALVIYRADDGKLWARNSAEFTDGRFRLAALASAPAGDGVEDREAQALADRLTKNQRAIIEGREYTDIDSRRARTRARSDVRSMGLVWSEGDGLTPLGKRVAAALARPRAAVGEHIEERATEIVEECLMRHGIDRSACEGTRTDARRILALQPPPAKVEG